MSLLDTIIAETANRTNDGPRVLSTNNNLNSINWVRGLSDPGEMIACGAYQELRRHADETDTAYQTRLEILLLALPASVRERITSAMKTAAIARAGLDTTNGKIAVMVAGEKAWHGLGVHVESAVNSADAIQLAGLSWQVIKAPAQYLDAAGTVRTSEDTYILYRSDNGAQLGTTGSRYKPIQNAEGFSFLDTVLAEFGAKYETCGAIFDGKQVWCQALLPKQSFSLFGGKDVTKAYATFSLDHTGAGADACYATTERAVCRNTFRMAQKDKAKGIRLCHTGNIGQKIADARRALALSVRQIDEYATVARAMTEYPLSVQELGNSVLDSILDISAAQMQRSAEENARDLLGTAIAVTQAQMDAEVKRVGRAMAKRETILDDIISRYESERCRMPGNDSAWRAFNAVTESADHGKWGKERTADGQRDSRHLESTMIGERDDAKQYAYNTVRTMMGM